MQVPEWSHERKPKPGSDRFRPRKGEEAIARELGGERRELSGAGEAAKYDAASPEFLVDLKETQAASHAVKRRDLADLERRALAEGRRPLYAVVFWHEGRGEPWCCVRLQDLQGLLAEDALDL